MTLYTAIPLANLILGAALFAVLIHRRVFRGLPLFVVWMAYSPATCLSGLAIARYAPACYAPFWFVSTAIDTLFYLCVLVALGKSILRYNRASSSMTMALLLFALLTVLTSALSQWTLPSYLSFFWKLGLRSFQATTILQLAGLLTLISWSNLRKLRWRERELRVVTGMGVWTIVAFGFLILQTHGLSGPRYHWLGLLAPTSVLGVLIYWLHYFWFEPSSLPVTPRHSAHARSAHSSGPQNNTDNLIGSAVKKAVLAP